MDEVTWKFSGGEKRCPVEQFPSSIILPRARPHPLEALRDYPPAVHTG